MKIKKKTQKKADRNKGTGTRKGDKPRQIHYIDDESTSRDMELARNDLNKFFDDVVTKHHGGW
jgi:hypothetical protein